MATKSGEILCFVFVAIGIGFWVSAMATPGWFLFHITLDSSSLKTLFPGVTGISTRLTKLTISEKWGIFRINTCIADICTSYSTHLLENLKTGKSTHLPSTLEMKIESVLTAILVALCLILLTPYKPTSKRYLAVVIILPLAGLPSGILIGRTAEANASISSALKILQLLLGKNNIGMDLPYSILLGAAGMLFATFSWVYSIVLFIKLRKISSQRPQTPQIQNTANVYDQGIPLQNIYTVLQNPH
ncbi:uncharacterized protein LOC128162067 [Crassostrea angulata]|uniref:uncharacterized protein LOC128162067 n=1 Tax=Magallana angulata TaxID=2784310 RepID=UPI0022B0BFD8|nr:uncharacterized protein LOC128162067 [Crassostrea angulata]